MVDGASLPLHRIVALFNIRTYRGIAMKTTVTCLNDRPRDSIVLVD